MAYDGKTLALARDRLDARREENAAELGRRTEQIYAVSPVVRGLDGEIQKAMLDLVRLAVQGGSKDEIAAVEKKGLELRAEKAEALVSLGFSADYLEEIAGCRLCRDKGFVKGEMCSCLKKLYDEEQARQLSTLCRLGEDSFSDFDLGYYPTEIDPAHGISPRECMEMALGACREFALGFGPDSPNLIFRGGTGLGKTMLSACVAKAVSQQGHSVVYETAVAAFEAFEAQKFRYDEEAAARARRFLECDLLILDDLGTEMTTSFTLSALYTIINSRLVSGKKTIISTNLTPEEQRGRYTQQIVSRLEGEYDTLKFLGDDIRAIKKQNRLNTDKEVR